MRGCYSEFNLTVFLRDDGSDEVFEMSRVFTPIFSSDDSSVTEMERVKDGRGRDEDESIKETIVVVMDRAVICLKSF